MRENIFLRQIHFKRQVVSRLTLNGVNKKNALRSEKIHKLEDLRNQSRQAIAPNCIEIKLQLYLYYFYRNF